MEEQSPPSKGWWQRLLEMLRPPTPEEPAPIPKPDLADTAPLSPESIQEIQAARVREKLEAGSAQSPGLERETNEDATLMMFGNSYGEEPLPEFGLFCLADGAGGLGHGELASSIAIKSVAHSLMEDALLKSIRVERMVRDGPIEELVHKAFERADEAVREGANGGVTTLTVVVMIDDRMTIGHVGDSRAYLVKNGAPKLLTRDHSFSARLVEIGQITPEEAIDHPKRNQLWNAVGQGSSMRVEVETESVPHEGHLLICSDGLWGEVSEEEISSVIGLHDEPNEACEELVRAANAAGGPDNISAILVTFPGI